MIAPAVYQTNPEPSAASTGHVQRARMVLMAAEGLSDTEVARRVGMTRLLVKRRPGTSRGAFSY